SSAAACSGVGRSFTCTTSFTIEQTISTSMSPRWKPDPDTRRGRKGVSARLLRKEFPVHIRRDL
ncbi:hypothetical protein AB0I20_45160, partial [Nonomuraea wenchangensis]